MELDGLRYRWRPKAVVERPARQTFTERSIAVFSLLFRFSVCVASPHPLWLHRCGNICIIWVGCSGCLWPWHPTAPVISSDVADKYRDPRTTTLVSLPLGCPHVIGKKGGPPVALGCPLANARVQTPSIWPRRLGRTLGPLDYMASKRQDPGPLH